LLTASASWQPISDFTIDRDGNKITFPTDHFSVWSLVALKSLNPPEAGDINGDGVLDLRDVIRALQICVQFEPLPIMTAADVNDDGTIGLQEGIRILRKLAELVPDI